MEAGKTLQQDPPNGHTSAGGRTGKSKSIPPPYWQHQRAGSYASVESTRPARSAGITLEDHTEESSDQCGALWAKSVSIDDHVIVSGSRTGVGAYVVWNCTVETLDGGPMVIRKRYSEFDELRAKLFKTFPNSEASMPPLPPKSVISKFRPKFLEKRREGLSYFLNCVLLNPEFSGSPVLKEFLFL
ncbi:MAG: PX domain-containing protein ypt35 [Pycnora praestabilis]|nr:MAG: PX domain-containing protein ypt35 [Pycnora praestabilis]